MSSAQRSQAPVWTADAGNGALKVVVWSGGPGTSATAVLRRTVARGPGFDPGARALFADVAESGAVAGALSSVLDADATARLVAVARERLGDRPLLAPPPHGLDNRCRVPEGVGQDRLFAARAAAERVRGSAIVVDVGTAMTVDAVRWDARAGGAPAFLGGAIAAGPELLARALGRGAARLFEVAVEPGVPALGRDTAEALRAGVVHGLRGAAAELVRCVEREAGLGPLPCVVTGGARALVLAPRPCFDGEVLDEPDLVHHGLLAALAERR